LIRKFKGQKILKEITKVREDLDEKDYVKRAAPYHPGLPDSLVRMERKIIKRRVLNYPYDFWNLKIKRTRRASIDGKPIKHWNNPNYETKVTRNGFLAENPVKPIVNAGNIYAYREHAMGTDISYQQVNEMSIGKLMSIIKHNIIANQRKLILQLKVSSSNNFSGYFSTSNRNYKYHKLDNADLCFEKRSIPPLLKDMWDDARLLKEQNFYREKIKELKTDREKASKIPKNIQKLFPEIINILKAISGLKVVDPASYFLMFPFIKIHLEKIVSVIPHDLPKNHINSNYNRKLQNNGNKSILGNQNRSQSPNPLSTSMQKPKQLLNSSTDANFLSLPNSATNSPINSNTPIFAKKSTFFQNVGTSTQKMYNLIDIKPIMQKENEEDLPRKSRRKIIANNSNKILSFQFDKRRPQSQGNIGNFNLQNRGYSHGNLLSSPNTKSRPRLKSAAKGSPHFGSSTRQGNLEVPDNNFTSQMEFSSKRPNSAIHIRIQGKSQFSRNPSYMNTPQKSKNTGSQSPYKKGPPMVYTMSVINNLTPQKLGPANLLAVTGSSSRIKTMKNHLYSLDPPQNMTKNTCKKPESLFTSVRSSMQNLKNDAKLLPFLKPCNIYRICNSRHLKYLFTKKFVKIYGEDDLLENNMGDGYNENDEEGRILYGSNFVSEKKCNKKI